eukprot:symbB.v1.2.028233.t1/scaffold2972.1/size66174/2
MVKEAKDKEVKGKKTKETKTKETTKASPKLGPKSSPKLSPKTSPKVAPKAPPKIKKRKAEEETGVSEKKPKKDKKQEALENPEKPVEDGDGEKVSLGVCDVSDVKEISDASQKALLSKNITRLFEIQQKAFEPCFTGLDVVGRAKTGCGKTLAFVLPVVERMKAQNFMKTSRKKAPLCVTIAPTRELARQIFNDFELLGAASKLVVKCFYGGTHMGEQCEALRQGVHVLVCTPGRLLDHAAHFERARFEQSMATIGMGMPRLPWEQGVFADIFNPGNDLVSHAMHLLPPLPGGPTSGFDEEKQTAPAIDPELDVRGADMPIFAKHVKALSDQDYEKKVDLQWTRALATWLAILEGSRFDSLVGYHVQERLSQQDREGALVVIRDACGVRSPNTVLKRGRDLQLFFSWAESNRGQWWPIKELHLLEYVRWTEKKQKSKLIGKNLQHGLKFFKHVMGAQFNLENLITPLMTGLVSRIASTKAVVDQARALTVVEIQNLEHQLENAKYALDRCYIGCLLFAVYSRSRWSDMANLDTFEFDIIETSPGPFGFVERRSRIHKTATSEERKTPYMPFVAPIWGITATPWGVNFKLALEAVGMLVARRPYGPLCRATRPDGTFTVRALTSAEGSSMMNDYMGIKKGDVAETTSHSLKATTLVWAARFGMDEPSRLLLGHHSTKENSLACYSRDLLAKPLRELGVMLLSIRNGQFLPDGTRSGWMASADKMTTDADRPMEAQETTEKEGEAQDVSSAAAEEVESEWSLLSLPSAFGDPSRLPVAEEGPTFSQDDDLVPELPPYFDKDFFASRMFQEPDRPDEPPNLGSFPEEADDVMYHVPMAVEGDLLQNKKSRMLHLRSKEEHNLLQPVSLCGLHGKNYAQRQRLRGMALEGPLEVAHCVYDTISGMMESDSLKYVPPTKCLTRLAEITAAKPPKELKLDANATGIIVKDSAVDASCPTSTEMDIFEALTRRALAFDAVGLIAFDIADKWHRYMFQLTRQQPPPGFKQPGMTQLLRADRQAFVRMQELSRGIRPLADGTRPLHRIVQELDKDHSVVYYLLPTPLPVKDKVEKQPNPKKEDTWGGHYRKHGDVKKWNDKSQWKGQGKSSGSGSGKLPWKLKGCASATGDGSRICFAYNIDGCNDAEAGGRPKSTTIASSIPEITALQVECNNQHAHLPWGRTPHGFATADEVEYPLQLCKEWARIVVEAIFKKGNFGTYTFPKNPDKKARAGANKQTRKSLAFMPEWSHVETFATSKAPSFQAGTKLKPSVTLDSHTIPQFSKILRVTHNKDGGEESGYQIAAGIPWSEENYIAEAADRGHPANIFQGLPKLLEEAIHNNVTSKPESLVMKRAQWFKKWTSRALQLSKQENELGDHWPQHRRMILQGKRFLVLKEILMDMDYPSGVVQEMMDGFDLIGNCGGGSALVPDFQPATLTARDLEIHSEQNNKAIMHSTKSSGTPEVDSELWRKTLEEEEKGWLKRLKAIPHDGGRVSRRFAVVQSEKVRPIDNYSESQINDAATVINKCTVDGVDTIAKVCRPHSLDVALTSKARTDSWQMLQWLALKLDIIVTCYFDDYVCVSRASLASNTAKCFETLLDLLGWKYDKSGDKADEMSDTIAALGVVFDLNRTKEGFVVVSNTEKRKADVCSQIQEAAQKGCITQHAAASLKGRLGFAEGQLFGRGVKRLINELGKHALHPPRGNVLQESTLQALSDVAERIEKAHPRLVDCYTEDTYLMFTDACFDSEAKEGGIGGVLIDKHGTVVSWFGQRVPRTFCESFMAENQEQAIGELEAFAVLTGLDLWKKTLKSKHLICFVDNEGARYLILKGYSGNAVISRIVHNIALVEERYFILPWYSRDLSACKTLILDEADEMLSMGFQDDIEAVMDELPTEGCQKLLFSATLPTWVNAIVERYLKKPTWIDVAQDPNGNTTNNLITHQCVSCPPSLRGDCIGDLCKIHAGAFGKTIVFVNTKNDCDELANHEKLKAIGAGILHGGILQHARDKTMESFRNGKIRCLVATDVAARGIDVPAVDLVVQTRPPQDLEAYVHRSGRTGRAGRKGTSVCFYSRAEEYLLRLIEHKKGIKMQRVGPPQAKEVASAAAEDAVRQMDMVHEGSVEAFTQKAKELIEERGAEVALAASIAALTGHFRELTGRSLLSAYEGYRALILESDRPIISDSKGWYLLRQMLPWEVAEQLKGCKRCMDEQKCIFDAPEHLVQKILQVELWKGNSITIAKELPELLEEETDIYAASQKLKETKQRFWERKKGGGKGEKGGKGKSEGKGKGKDGGKGGRGKGKGKADGRGRGFSPRGQLNGSQKTSVSVNVQDSDEEMTPRAGQSSMDPEDRGFDPSTVLVGGWKDAFSNFHLCLDVKSFHDRPLTPTSQLAQLAFMAVSLSTETLNWHCPPWGGTVQGPSYDRKAVKPGIVHLGISDFHRGHQAHFIDAILGSNEAGCLNWGISAVSLAPDTKMRHAMRKQDGMYTLCVRSGQECQTHIIGAYCEHLFAPDDHRKILHRLCAPSTKILSIMVDDLDYHLDENLELVESEEVQSDLQALDCQRLEDLAERPFQTLPGYLVATAMIRRMEHEVPVAVLADGPVAEAAMAMAAKTFGTDLAEYIQSKWRFPKMVCERVVYQVTPELLEETHRISGVADRCPVVCEDFVLWVVEDKFPAGRPHLDGVLNGGCLFVDDAAPFREIQAKVFYGAGQAVCYLGLLRGFHRVKDAVLDPIVANFLHKYLAVVLEHALQVPEGFDLMSYKEEAFQRLQQSNQDLMDLAVNGTSQIEKYCMACLPSFPKMDATSVKPLVLLLCFWLRYLAVAEDENETPFSHAHDDRFADISPLAQVLWRNAVKTSKGEGGETLRRPPPREDAKAFITQAFPRVDVGPTVLVEVMASQIVALRANDITTFLTTVARL